MANRKKAAPRGAAPSKGNPPARAERPSFGTRLFADQVVRDCIERMTGGRWVRGQTAQEVADEWGISEEQVKEYAARASCVIRLAVESDVEDIRARMLATLDTVVKSSIGDPKGNRAAVAAIDLQARLVGIAEQKHKVDVTVQTFAGLDDRSMLERVEQQIAELEELRRKLLVKTSVMLPALPAKEDDDG